MTFRIFVCVLNVSDSFTIYMYYSFVIVNITKKRWDVITTDINTLASILYYIFNRVYVFCVCTFCQYFTCKLEFAKQRSYASFFLIVWWCDATKDSWNDNDDDDSCLLFINTETKYSTDSIIHKHIKPYIIILSSHSCCFVVSYFLFTHNNNNLAQNSGSCKTILAIPTEPTYNTSFVSSFLNYFLLSVRKKKNHQRFCTISIYLFIKA